MSAPISTYPQYPINETVDFVTRVDRRQLSPLYAHRMKGFLNRKKGVVAERDLGTIHRMAVYPIRPNTFKVISGAADNGSGLVRITTATNHGYSTGDIIYHAEIGGCTEANNIYEITVIDATHYDLVDSTFANAYTSGGICTDTPIDIYDCFILRDPDTGTEYEVVVGIDENTLTRLYLWDGSEWIELTQKVNALINGAPSQPADTTTTQVVTIDTPTDEAGQVYTLGADTLNGFIVYNSTRGNASIVLDSTATTITIPHDVTIAPFSWANDDVLVFFRCTGIYDGFNYSNGADPHVRELLVEAQKKMTIFYADNSGSSKVRKDPIQIAKQDDARNLFYEQTTAGVKANGTIDVSGAVQDVDSAIINGREFNYTSDGGGTWTTYSGVNVGTLNDAINFDPVLSTIVSATGGGVVTVTALEAGTAGNSITLAQGAAGLVLSGATLSGGVDGVKTGRLVFASGFYAERSYFTTEFETVGTIDDPKLGTDSQTIITLPGTGIQIATTFSEANNAKDYMHLRVYFTLMYRGYQESDPVAKIVVSGSSTLKFPLVSCACRFDPSILNKDVTALRMYVAANTNAFATQSDWIENTEEYLFHDEILIRDTVFSYNNSSNYCYSAALTNGDENTYPDLLAAAADDLLTRLNHEPQTSRTALQPLFGLKVNRQQGAVQVVDQDDQTLRRSSYNGDGVHEDDNFPSVSVDEDDSLLHFPLSGSGEILELMLKNGIIHAHRKNEIETYNLFKNSNDYLLERNVAQYAIHDSARGLVFAGPAGVRYLPVGAGMAKTLNPLWDNFYDGTLLIDDASAAYITDAYREAMVSGHFSVLEEDWFASQVNIDSEDGGDSEYLVFRYSWKTSRWMVRKFHLGDTAAPNLDVSNGQSEIRSLRERSDGTMMIVTKRGLFKYPYTGARRYEDGVYSDGRSSSRGIPADITLNIGGLSNAIPGANILAVKVQHKASSVNKDSFARMRFYRNDRISPSETKRFRVDDPPIIRELERQGTPEAMMIRIDLPEDDNLENQKDFQISQIIFVHEPNQVPVSAGR